MQTIDMTAAEQMPPKGVMLFRLMARFEYSLKELGYGIAGKHRSVEANWDEFANKCLTQSFYRYVREQNLAPTILNRPPSRQILSEGKLDWEGSAPPQDIQSLIGAVRRVRNNLFHGGKSGDKDSDRDALLVEEAIAVLTEALMRHSNLRQLFEGKW